MKPWAIALFVLILAALACNDANQTVTQASSPTDKVWSSVLLTPKTPATDVYKWQEISIYEIKDFSVFDNGPFFGYAYSIVGDREYHHLPSDQVLVLQLNDGSVKYFELQNGKLMISTGQ